MSELAPRVRRPPRKRRRGRVVVLLLAGAVVFAVGVALGEALHDNPEPSRVQHTVVRTLVPLPPETVTVGTP